jgi:hypothetical protein
MMPSGQDGRSREPKTIKELADGLGLDPALLYSGQGSPPLEIDERPRELTAREHRGELAVPGARSWPELAPEAMHGLAAEFVLGIAPHTEADPVALLVQFLLYFGNCIGRTAYFTVEADRHYMNLFAVLVGATSKGRKGTSAGQVGLQFAAVDPDWKAARIASGLSSGEGLIWQVRDPVEKLKGGSLEVVDVGVDDKRLLCLEGEFAQVLRVLARDGNTLSAVIRNAWDTGALGSLTKNSPARAIGAHISIVGHTTRDELLRYLDSTEAGNGFGNRFLWVCVRRSKALPEGGQAHTVDFAPFQRELRKAVEFARQVGELRKDDAAREVWAGVYPELSEGRPGLLGAVMGRAEAQALRLSALFALLAGSRLIAVDHLLAGLALWRYCEESAAYIFGDSLGDPDADDILGALRHAEEGMTRDEIRNLFNRHRSAVRIGRSLAALLEAGRVRFERQETSGRPAERWFAVSSIRAESALSAETSPPSDLSALSALSAQVQE